MNRMKVKRRLRWILLASLAAAALSAAIIPRTSFYLEWNARRELRELWSRYTPITLGEVIQKQNLGDVILSVRIYNRSYEFKTPQGFLRLLFSRCYNLDNKKLLVGNHSVVFDYGDLGRRFKRTAREIETILEQDPLIGESAESLHSFFAHTASATRGHIEQICLPGETEKFDDFLGDLEALVQEEEFSVDGPFEAVLINNYHPARVQDASPNKLDEEIKARLLSSDNEFTYVSPEEIERLNKIFGNRAEEWVFDVKKSSFEETLFFYQRTIRKQFTRYKGKMLFNEEKNKQSPSSILTNPNRIPVTCGPPTLYLGRLINYANEVNPNFRHIHALLTVTLQSVKGQKGREFIHHAIIAVIDTENRKISFLDPYGLVAAPFVFPYLEGGNARRTSYRSEMVETSVGQIGDSAAGLNWRQFLEESRRNLKRSY